MAAPESGHGGMLTSAACSYVGMDVIIGWRCMELRQVQLYNTEDKRIVRCPMFLTGVRPMLLVCLMPAFTPPLKEATRPY